MIALAAHVCPDQLRHGLLIEEVAVRGGRRGFLASMNADAGLRQLEQTYPGITEALWSASIR